MSPPELVRPTRAAYSSPKVEPLNPLSADLLQHVDSHTFRQVRDLEISYNGLRVRVTGKSKTYYIKQLVTHAILASLPSAELENEIKVAAH